MSIKGLMVAGTVAAVVALAGCHNQDSTYQQQPQYSASQSGYSSKLGKLGTTNHAANRHHKTATVAHHKAANTKTASRKPAATTAANAKADAANQSNQG